MASHQKCCKQNPSRVKQERSPLAGSKKGCIPWNKGKSFPHKGKRKNYPDDLVFNENSKRARHYVKREIRERKLIDYVCSVCGIGPEWLGKPMPLILDHINGISNDNRLENLRFVCSNCDTQLPTYKSKNRVFQANGGLVEMD